MIPKQTASGLNAEEVAQILPGRLPHGRPLVIMAKGATVECVPNTQCSFSAEGSNLQLSFTSEAVAQLVEKLGPKSQTIHLPAFPTLEIIIEKSEITDSSGKVVNVIG